ncbi:NAD(P)-binding protein [Desulfosporosinus sp. PR]|uniref:NAD(P)-binding protein n=1 Tax=Candidatus Desulfosporosinus nitrosoreducens TaxID=3401928 RepID=UPI0027EC15C5|nr:NAD(P)-binding protein [Desulfosporosinus sp. PR]MDQ7092946.1 NAD(P)-binding protein [Desulfosporosinus sp. PR]
MEIAIMGAGLSGLACAITLEKYGIKPILFEKRSRVGDRFVNGEAFLPALNRPINDCYAYLAEKHGINLHPVSNIKKITLLSETNKATLHGHLGFLNIRGRDHDSLECQLSRQVKSEINFNSQIPYETLLQDFTHVVLATGDAAYTAKIQDFQQDLTVTLKGATIEGSFDKRHVGIWLNNNFAPQGYGYLLPFSEKEATITLGYPDYPHNQRYDLETLWQKFYRRVCKDLHQELRITDNFEVTRYMFGTCRNPRIGNTFFAGNCVGAMMPAFGFGQLASILSGIFVADDLCGLGNYNESLKPLKQSYRYSLAVRRAMEQLDNHKLDVLVRLCDSELVNSLITSQNFNLLKMLGFILQPYLWKTRQFHNYA